MKHSESLSLVTQVPVKCDVVLCFV